MHVGIYVQMEYEQGMQFMIVGRTGGIYMYE